MKKWKKELRLLFVTVVISLVFVFLTASNIVLAASRDQHSRLGQNAGNSITSGDI